MFITDHNDGARSDAGHVNDVNILFHCGCGDKEDEKEQLTELVSSLFMRFDTNGNGKLEMPEARNMISTLLNINEHWSGASEALKCRCACPRPPSGRNSLKRRSTHCDSRQRSRGCTPPHFCFQASQNGSKYCTGATSVWG